MDTVDRAEETIETCTDEAIRRVQLQNAPQTHPDFDGWHCVDCEEDIPHQRLAMGKIRCTDCQAVRELKGR